MQQTRRHILEILKERKEATIDEIVVELSDRIGKITAVTVRHHLEILRGDGLVGAPTVRRRSAPGRPQYVYTLTERAADMFPNNYQGLASGLLEQIKGQLSAEKVDDILGGIAENMIAAAMVPDAPIEIRLDHVVAFLNHNGYTASWSRERNGHTLSIINCPYEQISCSNAEVCAMDKKMIEGLVGAPTQRVSWRWEDERDVCVYIVENGR
jgi:predicted ArsR family transcriptional regulator